jgi:hypothetical protein
MFVQQSCSCDHEVIAAILVDINRRFFSISQLIWPNSLSNIKKERKKERKALSKRMHEMNGVSYIVFLHVCNFIVFSFRTTFMKVNSRFCVLTKSLRKIITFIRKRITELAIWPNLSSNHQGLQSYCDLNFKRFCIKKKKPWPWWLRFHVFSKLKILILYIFFNLEFKHCIKLLIWNRCSFMWWSLISLTHLFYTSNLCNLYGGHYESGVMGI